MQKVIHVSNGAASFILRAAISEGRVFSARVGSTLIVALLISTSDYVRCLDHMHPIVGSASAPCAMCPMKSFDSRRFLVVRKGLREPAPVAEH